MINSLDHTVLICSDIDAGRQAYETLFGRTCDWRSQNENDGSATAWFQLENTALELMAPSGDGPVGDRLRDLLTEQGEGLVSLAFGTADIADAHHTLTRRGLHPDEISSGESTDISTGRSRHWRRFRCADTATAGVKSFLIDRDTDQLAVADATADQVFALDHLVVNTPNPDRAMALYGAKFDLRLALDRTREEWGTRFLFFRVGGLTFEVIHRLGEDHDPSANDSLWGTTWKVASIEAAHARLEATGLDISEIRTGRKPGTRVFTIREQTLGVPTLFLEHKAP